MERATSEPYGNPWCYAFTHHSPPSASKPGHTALRLHVTSWANTFPASLSGWFWRTNWGHRSLGYRGNARIQTQISTLGRTPIWKRSWLHLKTSIFKANKADFEFSALPSTRLTQHWLADSRELSCHDTDRGKGGFPKVTRGWGWGGGKSKDTGIHGS